MRYNDWSRTTYERIHGGQKTRKKKAAIALARKIAGGGVGDAEKQDGLGPGKGWNRRPANCRRRFIKEYRAGRCDRVNDLTQAPSAVCRKEHDVEKTNVTSGFFKTVTFE